MTRRTEKDYIKVVENLSVKVAFTSTDRWRGMPSTPLLDPADTPYSILQIHLKQQ
jgi:hypothetical protein